MFTRFVCLLVAGAILFGASAITSSIAAGDESKPALVANSICPVSGKPVAGKPEAPTFFSDFRGWRIGFMCPVCKGQFDAADDAQKLAYLNRALKSVGKPPAT
jgi:hypothetical protein